MNALVEKEIESKIATLLSEKFESLNISNYRIGTSWEAALEVKGEESPDDKAIVTIAAASPRWDSYLDPCSSIPVTIAIVVRRETSPDGALLLEITEGVARFLIALQLDVSVANLLSGDSYSAHGVLVENGAPPAFNKHENIWSVTRSFTVRGTVEFSEPAAEA